MDLGWARRRHDVAAGEGSTPTRQAFSFSARPCGDGVASRQGGRTGAAWAKRSEDDGEVDGASENGEVDGACGAGVGAEDDGAAARG